MRGRGDGVCARTDQTLSVPITQQQKIKGSISMKALIISADNFEDSELLFPFYRLKEEGLQVDIASVKRGTLRGKHGYEVAANKDLNEIIRGDYDLLILPGGKAPEALRKEKAALTIAKHFFENNKPVSAICHGDRKST